MFEQGAGHAEIAFRILEVDRVHLMRHCRAARFILIDPLLEIIHRDIGPDVPAEIDQDRIDAPPGYRNARSAWCIAAAASPARLPRIRCPSSPSLSWGKRHSVR